ncbi:hypothetical protein BD626DRAFT_505873 [Schizophyllum amplum]|uniref:Uncharacterized protein n=1 Tax=Schizophyllum amplum TaxID=97359 RepID=A0A550C601_9AGAR|nr:hypothetical protein BD626DRAFT_505873 [Auriculariopsis ampla]
MADADADSDGAPQKQCRICFDGTDAESELGRLIRPCLCRGSISYVHVECLKRWRLSSTSSKAYYECPQCHYQYRVARTRAVGIATNPMIIGALSGVLFTALVMLSSVITTYLMARLDEDAGYNYWYYGGPFYVAPYDLMRDLIRAALRILQDGDVTTLLDEAAFGRAGDMRGKRLPPLEVPVARGQPGLVMRLLRRFVLGLPVVGAGSLIQMLLTVGYLAPIHWLARYRARRRTRGGGGDVAALVIVGLLLVGAFRALYTVYQFTRRMATRFLSRAEDAILEVNT